MWSWTQEEEDFWPKTTDVPLKVTSCLLKPFFNPLTSRSPGAPVSVSSTKTDSVEKSFLFNDS